MALLRLFWQTKIIIGRFGISESEVVDFTLIQRGDGKPISLNNIYLLKHTPMKKIFSLTVFCAIIFSFSLSAQQFEWARQMSGGSNEQGSHLAIDQLGNVYTVGLFSGVTDFDPTSATLNITAVGDYDIFLTKFDANGNMLWLKTMGGIGADFGYGVTVDLNGDVYILSLIHI